MKTATYEKGSFYYFDVSAWEKVRKDGFTLFYDQIETSVPIAIQEEVNRKPTK
jgi:CCR4-NOT transcriptional regulation complex NOT5 subunit